MQREDALGVNVLPGNDCVIGHERSIDVCAPDTSMLTGVQNDVFNGVLQAARELHVITMQVRLGNNLRISLLCPVDLVQARPPHVIKLSNNSFLKGLWYW
jgi:hypothetical protein